ncbi:kinase-like domain-containing protein [Rhizophagus clarus]|uniref:Kinase-like domain-containing protein n=1 Tax=Rhizophagus clarus TaxID=94130 RepID=A0A8H3M292_9GLOM|nr:kinase-like domain-containing protein [Rhizophagus clarus]
MGNTTSSSTSSSSPDNCEKCNKRYTNRHFKWCRTCQINYLKKNNLVNLINGNKKIDDLIKKMQLKSSKPGDTLFEWIPYNQFIDIKEIFKDDLIVMYSAIWENGPLNYDYYNEKGWNRESNKNVVLKYLHTSQNINDEFLNDREYTVDNLYAEMTNSLVMIYGISQNPVTKDYIMVLQDKYCKECGKKYTDIFDEWLIWKDGPLMYDKNEYIRGRQNKKVTLKCSRYFGSIFLKEVIEHLTETGPIYGISQNPNSLWYCMVVQDEYCKTCGQSYELPRYKWCVPCQRNHLEGNFINWTSGNENIDKFIQNVQLEISTPYDMVFEWVPCNQFDDIKEIAEVEFAKLYSATWKDGPLYYDGREWERVSKKVNLRRLHNSQNITYKTIKEEFRYYEKAYGITQDPNTKDYIMIHKDGYYKVFCGKCGKRFRSTKYKLCIPCNLKAYSNQKSGSVKIDHLIKKIQSRVAPSEVAFEWIPYEQLVVIKELCKDDLTKLYSANWKEGPLDCHTYDTRYKNEKVILRCFIHPLGIQSIQSILNKYLRLAQRSHDSYPLKYGKDLIIYGISKNPSTNEFIFVLNAGYHCESCVENDQTKVYSAIWDDGPLEYDYFKLKWTREPKSNTKVALKYLCNSQNITEDCLNEVKTYTIGFTRFNIRIYGISQNPDTKDYIMVLEDKYCRKCGEVYTNVFREWCKSCQTIYLKNLFSNYTSENKNINDLIQVMQSKIDKPSDTIFEWIPYNQFDNIKEIGKGGFAKVYSAIWKDGPLRYNLEKQGYTRKPNVKVALKCLNNSQDITDMFLNEVKAYSIKDGNYIMSIYGISQNLEMKNYVMVLEYAEGGTLSDWINKNYKDFDWKRNILLEKNSADSENIYPDSVYIADMGLSGQVSDNIYKIDKGKGIEKETKVYGVLPYVAPEVLNGKCHSQASDIYSFGMIMYFIATGSPPFADRANDNNLAYKICYEDLRPEVNKQTVPKCYIDLMKRCWDSNPDNRPSATELEELIDVFYISYLRQDHGKIEEIEQKQRNEIKAQFEHAESNRNECIHFSSTDNHSDHDNINNDNNNVNVDNNDHDTVDKNNNDFSDQYAVELAVEQFIDETVVAPYIID